MLQVLQLVSRPVIEVRFYGAPESGDLHQILAGNVITKLSISFQSSGVVATLEIFFIGCN